MSAFSPPVRPDPRRIECLTFDCYGTLIDWLGGLERAVRATPSLRGCDIERWIADRGRFENELEAGPYLPYGQVVAESARRAASEQGLELSAAEGAAIATSQSGWPPFAETPGALARLSRRYRLAILSNVETKVLRASVRLLGVPFAALITAEDLGSYKPALPHFAAALEQLDVPRERVLHVAQSLYHDVRPALALGWSTAWVDRTGERLPDDVAPHWVVPDLTSLVRELGV